MRGHLEPLTRVRVLAARGRNLDVLTQAETVDAYANIREDLDRLAAAAYVAELIRRFAPEHEALPGLYALAVAALELLCDGGRLSLLRGFEVHILAETGFALGVEACASCHGRLPEEEGFLCPGAGGLLCRQCRRDTAAGRMVSVAAIKVLRHAGRTTLQEFAGLRMAPGLEEEVEAALGEVIRYVLDAEPRTARFIQSVRETRPAALTAGPGSPL
jgi:DNA repair protein RecO (recombination protein O)